MTKYDKYEIYVDKTELATYIESNKILDRGMYPNEFCDGDFALVYKDKGYVNFFDKQEETINGIGVDYIDKHIPSPIKVTAEEFLTTIGYLEEDNHKLQTTEKLKLGDVLYLDSFYPSDMDYLWLSEYNGDICLQVREGGCDCGIYLSSESLISLGKDLIQIGIQKQIEEESNED